MKRYEPPQSVPRGVKLRSVIIPASSPAHYSHKITYNFRRGKFYVDENWALDRRGELLGEKASVCTKEIALYLNKWIKVEQLAQRRGSLIARAEVVMPHVDYFLVRLDFKARGDWRRGMTKYRIALVERVKRSRRVQRWKAARPGWATPRWKFDVRKTFGQLPSRATRLNEDSNQTLLRQVPDSERARV